ncbi:anaerobic sulfatase maturase [Thermoanaerobacterium thermosaccharolyticum]|uniref:Anaerobic sulfatase maturase n=1 Tax=Thermoanaerobacterium thermosaccharolyticum TaxID=1517 RepID=A0A231VK12_THETR|nr:anaerobic sulfatase maturase [Thermoanaerobacterium thermosaccharolyticum]OXT08447.1 anaerobic sulfatase maturase [Thermoanaerobacterium thermosaccharolyticum]
MPPVNVLVKPASCSCNLLCKYCFYYDVIENRNIKNYGIMSHDTIEILVKKVFEFGERFVSFAFQGGEPTLAGIDFYRRVIELQQKYNIKKIKVNNALQTNGVVINEEWAQFLSQNNFLVGLSLDGPRDIHNINRVNFRGVGSYNMVEKTVKLFNEYNVEYNILCVVTKSVARHIEKIYNYYSKNGFRYLQFIPCLDEFGTNPGKKPYSLTPDVYGDFLKKLFDLWYRDFINGRRISIRMFDNILQILLGYEPESCDMKGYCSANVVIEADGSVYPCDFYVLDEWRMGNILNDDLQTILYSEKAIKFVEISKQIFKLCNQCEFFYVCRGGCRRHYEPIIGGTLEKNYFCLSYKKFYEYSLPRFYEIAEIMSR